MGQYFKAITIFLGLLLNALMSAGSIYASISVSNAESFKAQCINEIENSNFNDGVINGCIADATNNGYTLTVNKIILDADADTMMAEVILEYPFKIGVLHINNTHQTSGIAR